MLLFYEKTTFFCMQEVDFLLNNKSRNIEGLEYHSLSKQKNLMAIHQSKMRILKRKLRFYLSLNFLKPKIFVIGMNKTGTTTLEHSLKELDIQWVNKRFVN